MTDDIKPELIEKAAKALADDWKPDRDPVLTAMFRDYAHTALEAVADELRAVAWDEGFAAGVNTDMGDWEHPPEECTNPYRTEARDE